MKIFSFLFFAIALTLAAGPERPDHEAPEKRYENRLNPDTNGDFKVTSLELKAWVPKAIQYYAEFALKAPRHTFIKFCADFDKNSDAKIDATEVKNFQEHCQALVNYHNDQIAKFDINRNGKLDPGSEQNQMKNKYKTFIPGDGFANIKGSDLELYKNRRLDDIYD